MNKINSEIKNDFITFTRLVIDRKNTTERQIYLNDKKPSRKDTNYYEKPLVYNPENIKLIIEARQDVRSCFRFKLRCQTFTDEPYFRFDSDGATHMNLDDSNGLLDRKVTTPHFNTYNNAGVVIAYKTVELKNPEVESVLLNDISLCFAHFCHESNIRFPEEEFSEVIPFSIDVIPLDLNNEDPLANIDFNG
ncbi:hypothetical protein [Pedobacter panaciterrae]